MDIVKSITETNNANNLISSGEKNLKNNRFFQFIDLMMNDPKMRSFFDEFFSDWDDIKTTIMIMKAYQVIDIKIKELETESTKSITIDMRRKMMIGMIKEMIANSECRQELVKNMNQFMGIEKLDACKSLVSDRTSTMMISTKNKLE